MTKEELLEKGLSSDHADEVISLMSDEAENDTPLLALEKAISGDGEEEELTKADDNDEDDEDGDDYDEEYMKKNMKRYMKENKASAKEAGLFGDKMEKAVSDLDLSAEGAVIEMMDLAPILEDSADAYQGLAKAVETISGVLVALNSKVDKSYDLMEKASRVHVATAQSMDKFLETPTGRKSQTVDMAKAITPNIPSKDLIYATLEKAMKSGVNDADVVLSSYESNGRDMNKLNRSQRRFVANLLEETK